MRVYAFTAEDGFYPISASESYLDIYQNDWSSFQQYLSNVDSNNKYKFNNPQIDNVYAIKWGITYPFNYDFTFPYNPELYDYYILGNIVSYNTDFSKSTFKPRNMTVYGVDYASQQRENYPLNGLVFYDIDSDASSGFGWSAKVEFGKRDNIGISYIEFTDDKDILGNKPANLVFELGVMAIPKSTSESDINQRILNKLTEMQKSITDSIGSAANQVTDAIEKQYGMTPDESFGVQDLTSQIEEKLGVLSFGADTLNNFLGLFQASNAGSTVLTFPGFTIDVQGESYQVWNDIQFDLAFLEENFGILIVAVRTVTVLCVWLAVLGYLVKAYEHLVNNKG